MAFNAHQWFLMGQNKFQLSWSFDSLNTTEPLKSAFLIRRESDNVEQTFTFSETINGTYATFISATNGAVKKWFGDKNFIEQQSNLYQPRLIANSGNPYVDDYTQGSLLMGNHYASLINDSIVTLVFKDELEVQNQKSNISIRGFGTDTFALNLTPTVGYVAYDKTGNAFAHDYNFTYLNNGIFKLLTFTRIGGVKKIYINNVEATKGISDYTMGSNPNLNSITLGARQDAYGKITKYQHLGLFTGADLSAFNVSTYNTNIMSKYGIV